LKDLLGIKSNENSSINKQQVIDANDDFF